MAAQVETTIHVGGRRLRFVRVAWVMATLLVLGVFVLAIPARYRQLRTLAPAGHSISYSFPFVVAPDTADAPLQLSPADERALRQFGITVGPYAAVVTGLEVAFALACALMGVAIFWRGSDSRIALYTAFALVMLGLAFPPTLNALARAGPAQRWLVAIDLQILIGIPDDRRSTIDDGHCARCAPRSSIVRRPSSAGGVQSFF